jgi:hypothetical protein
MKTTAAVAIEPILNTQQQQQYCSDFQKVEVVQV